MHLGWRKLGIVSSTGTPTHVPVPVPTPVHVPVPTPVHVPATEPYTEPVPIIHNYTVTLLSVHYT